MCDIFFPCRSTGRPCGMVVGSCYVDISHPAGHYIIKFLLGPSPQKILGAPLFLSVMSFARSNSFTQSAKRSNRLTQLLPNALTAPHRLPNALTSSYGVPGSPNKQLFENTCITVDICERSIINRTQVHRGGAEPSSAQTASARRSWSPEV